jgi:hypothetical protein
MDFSDALYLLKDGHKVAREGWNGKGMWLTLTDSWTAVFSADHPLKSLPPEWQGYSPFIAMYTADKKLVPWLASQTDILAEDWQPVT